MSSPTVTLGYVILYVQDVAASLEFYERAFGLSRRFFHQDGVHAYGELETGGTRLAFASIELGSINLPGGVVAPSMDGPPLGAEIALVSADVPALFTQALRFGATALSEPAEKPWGQTVAYVRDNSGHLVELCTPTP